MTATLRTDFNEFLLAPIGGDATGMPLTLLTGLARLGIDPWEEAADLARLSRASAIQRLVARLEAFPQGLLPEPDNTATATRLIALLERLPEPKVRSPGVPPQIAVAMRPRRVDRTIYYLVAVILMLVAQWAVTRQPQAPADTTHTPDTRN